MDLVRRCQAGDSAAGGILVAANDRLIYKTVKRYFNKGLAAEDVLQSARLGYFEGIMRFDFSHGNRLNTYAIVWAIKEAHDALQETGSTIRLPKRVHEALRLASKTGEPLDDELAEAKRLRFTASLDVPLGRRDAFSRSSMSYAGNTYGDRVPCAAPLPDDVLVDGDAQARSKALIRRALTWLTARQREVIERHLLAEEPEPFESIGASLGVTKQGAEELQKRAKVKLRAALRRIMEDDDAVLWGGDLPAGPMRPRRPVAAPPPVAADDEPPPTSRVIAARRRRGKAARTAAVARPKAPTENTAASAIHGT
ncbi:sigma-70 family RNA polymerase sigma factor [Sorangium sp. So ce1024]|uniref:sigma-70 family RNA polymerase sigma factor n=1 Tax=Sorangium sp. So ce1024 TaxID=3133327 RepID=UPI003F0D6A95